MSNNKCRWRSKLIDYGCSEPPLPNDPDSYCILHSKNEDKDLNEFTKKVTDRIEKGPEEIDLRGCYFPKKFPSNYFLNHTFDKPVYFLGATFSQEVSFYNTTFSKVNFSGAAFLQHADFYRVTFSQGAYFAGAKFSQANFYEAIFSKANFSRATFSKEADFSGATFSQWTSFTQAKFSQEVDFSRTAFSQDVYFSWAVFSQKAKFRVATFSQKTDFSFAEFSEVDFTGIAFEKGVNFHQTGFKDRVSFLPAGVIRKVVIGPSSFQHTHFLGEVLFQDVDLSQCSFLHSNIDRVDFRYCTFAKKEELLFRIISTLLRVFNVTPVMKDERLYGIIPQYRQNVLKDELDCEREAETAKSVEDKKKAGEGYEPVRRVYLELKQNLENKKDWNTAGDFHFGEMECRRKKKGWLGRKLSLVAFYCWASGYGERPLRAFLTLLALVFVVFPLLYICTEGNNFSTSVWNSLNAATFMKLGNPINLQTGLGKCLAAIEFILSPTLITLLVLALRRKVKR